MARQKQFCGRVQAEAGLLTVEEEIPHIKKIIVHSAPLEIKD